jgi:hypothetical protein
MIEGVCGVWREGEEEEEEEDVVQSVSERPRVEISSSWLRRSREREAGVVDRDGGRGMRIGALRC